MLRRKPRRWPGSRLWKREPRRWLKKKMSGKELKNDKGKKGDVKPTVVELEIFASNLANMFSTFIVQFFPKCLDKMKNLHKST